MLKYLSIIALAIGCTSVANAQIAGDPAYKFDFRTFDTGQINPTNSSYTAQAISVVPGAAPISVTLGWENAAISKGGSDLVQFKAAPNADSILTLNFGDYTATRLTFTIFGLSSSEGNWNSKGGNVTIGGVSDVDNIFVEHEGSNTSQESPKWADLTDESGGDYYERKTGWNRNGTAIITVVIREPVSALTLYFSSQEYQISSMTFEGRSAIPEPSTYAAIIGLGIAGFAIIRRRSRKA